MRFWSDEPTRIWQTSKEIMPGPRYLEDLAVGDVHPTGSVEVTEAEAVAFASRYDPQPMHTRPDAAKAGVFGGLIASGWHTAAMVMRLIVDARPLGETPVLGLGVDELRWPKPVRPGDIIQAETEVVSITPSQSKPDYGVVRLKVTARNQLGETVFTMIPKLWVPRRPER
jgi:acyl dehydratase